MKKGISLIVLVITIIVMIIIAGAIIISLNNSKIIENANTAVLSSNRAEATSIMNVKFAELLAAHYTAHPTVTYTPNATDEATLDAYVKSNTGNKWGVTLSGTTYTVVDQDPASGN